MKVAKHIYIWLAAMILVLAAGCTPDDNSMGTTGITSADLQEGIAFTLSKDIHNPNLIHLKSLLSGKTVYWIHPGVGLGHSEGDTADLKIAFAGKYPVVYGVDTPAGAIYSDTSYVNINDFCADFVSGEAWTYLAGGAGGSKAWVPDNGNFGMKQGFYSCFSPDATPADMVCDKGTNNWYAKGLTWWEPSNADVGVTASDLAQTMTFSLKGSAVFSVTNADGKTSVGSFTYDPVSGALNASGVEFPHGAWADGKSKSFSKDFIVLHLSENQLMIANKRDKALSGEDPCYYVWNFVSKDYADNYKKEQPTEPALPVGWQDSVQVQKKTELTWILDEDVPFDYFTLGGNRKNNWAKVSDYPSFIAPLSGLSQYQLILDSEGGTYRLKSTSLGTIASGTYTVSSKGIYTFSNGLGTVLIGGTWVNLSADTDNQLRLLDFTYDKSSGKTTEMWLGAKQNDIDGTLYQYLGYHFETAPDTGEKTSYLATLIYQTSDWVSGSSPEVKVQDDGETYTCTLTGTQSNIYCLYLDVKKLLVDHPKATLVLKEIKVDGKVLTGYDWSWSGFTEDNGAQITDDDKTGPRIYICNPWNASSTIDNPFYKYFQNGGNNCVPLNYTQSLAVMFQVHFND